MLQTYDAPLADAGFASGKNLGLDFSTSLADSLRLK
jgi:hypothetical protein